MSSKTGREIFCWSEDHKSYVKGAFYFGYVFLQVPGGRMSEVHVYVVGNRSFKHEFFKLFHVLRCLAQEKFLEFPHF